jgi:hypothetical protein
MLLVVSATTPWASPADVVAAARAKPASEHGTAESADRSSDHRTDDDMAKIQMTTCLTKARRSRRSTSRRTDHVMISEHRFAPLMKSEIKALAVTSDSPSGVPRSAAARDGAAGFNVDIWPASSQRERPRDHRSTESQITTRPHHRSSHRCSNPMGPCRKDSPAVFASDQDRARPVEADATDHKIVAE